MKRGQVTIFVIIGVVIVAIIALFFLMKGNVIPGIGGSREANPRSAIETCLNDKTEEIVSDILEQGGYVNPKLSLVFDDKNVSYLCYTDNYYLPCVNQEPLLIKKIEDEIKENIQGEVENCFNDNLVNLERQGYDLTKDYNGFDVELSPKRVTIKIDSEITYSQGDQTATLDGFDIVFLTRLYDLAIVAQEITTQEANYCNFDHTGFGLLYPEYKIDLIKTSNLNKVYTVQDKKTEEEFKFAIRGCVIPPGF